MISGTNAISIKFTHHMKIYKTIAVAYFGSLDNFELTTKDTAGSGENKIKK